LEGESCVFYAHSSQRTDKSDWQLLRTHLEAVAERAERGASYFGAGPIARLAGLLHDLGKYTQEFQLRLSGEFPRMDHATWGARVACERYGSLGQLLAYSIAGHHAGLANGRDGQTRPALQDKLNAKPEHSLVPVWQSELPMPSPADLKCIHGFQICKERLMFQQSMLGRMIFSCLVDADFLDTEEFYVKAEGRTSHRSSPFPSLEQLRQQLERKLSGFKPDSPVNCLRAEVLGHVRQQAEQVPGLFSLTVPTGGGKTLASLAFALDHAIRHGLRRVIYVIPFTSVVEQNAAVFREALGDLGQAAVLEHHSSFVDDPKKDQAARDKLHLAMENWDAPIVVTTAVQFFESLFANRPSRCRKLHNITGSVVILDEAQTLPLKLLRPCVTALDELTLNYRTSVVLCTATQPALTAADGFRDGFKDVGELAPSPQRLYEQFRRVKVRHAGRLTQEALTDLLCRHEQVLCIVNNRRHARALYESIATQPGARHLTTLMYAKHRTRVLNEVRRLLKSGEPCRLVATSLIEAGVDVDFPLVLRAEAGLDSIAQAAGRCNREGRRSPNESEVLVFAMDGDEWAPPPELKQFAQVFREVHRLHSEDPLSLAAINDYFKALYWQRGPLELDSHDLLGLLKSSRVESLPFETLSQQSEKGLFRKLGAGQGP
jgi:CRISPR-associated endonuclease/helicase Cas3